jgi:hypothetical protein
MQTGKIFSKGTFVFPALLVFMILAGAAAAQPALPCAFYGAASINGRPVPAGSVITAQIDGISRGSIVISKEGKYGGLLLDDGKLNVFEGSNGAEITFYVQTPSMGNRLEAGQKGTWESGEVTELDFTFTGEEIPRSEPAQAAQGGGSGSSGGTGGSQETPVEQPAADQSFQDTGHVYDISANISSGNVSLNLAKGDEVKFTYNGKDVSVKVKSMSEFAVLFTVAGNDLVMGEKSSGLADVNGDGFAELQITVGKVKDNKAEVTLSLLEKPVATSGAGATGMIFTDGNGLWISVYAIVILAILGGGIYLFKKRGVKNEGYQGYSE